MDTLLYLMGRALVSAIQLLPLVWVARLGRAGGALAYGVDARHRRVALRNLTRCFAREKSAEEIRAMARENFRRIGENFASAIKTASMTRDQLAPHFEITGGTAVLSQLTGSPARSAVAAIGHFGNFELYARFSQFMPSVPSATTYRGLRQPGFDRLLRSLRGNSDCVFFERRTDAAALKIWMQEGPGRMLGLLADQSAGGKALRLPFLGQECGTSAAPAVLALRYNCLLFTAICYRIGLARWRVEAGQEIPTHENGIPRSMEAIMREVNLAFEAAVRRDPANWFWVHNRWKPGPQSIPIPAAREQSRD